MPKLKKTLPKNFQEIIDNGNDEAIKAEVLKCEVGAYHGTSKNTALFFTGLSRELVEWLMQRGEKINHRNRQGKTPLHAQAESANGAVALYLELGADIDAESLFDKETPLFSAVTSYQTENVKILLEHGADIRKRETLHNRNPLETLLARCMNAYIEKTAEMAVLFLDAGMQVSEDMKKSIVRIGKDYEFFKDQFPPEFAEPANRGMKRLYELFHVPPVPPVEKYDRKSPITVGKGNWWKCHDELWQKLVPSRGQAGTVQGEVIRCSGKIARELMDNGAMNWDSDYCAMLKAIPAYFQMGNPLNPAMQRETEAIVSKILSMRYPEMIDREPERIMEFAVEYVRQNPNPIQLDKTDYGR